MADELIVIIRRRGFNNWKELAQFAKRSLNLRNIEGYKGAFKYSEMVGLFEATFNMGNKEAKELAGYLTKMGFVRHISTSFFKNYICSVFNF